MSRQVRASVAEHLKAFLYRVIIQGERFKAIASKHGAFNDTTGCRRRVDKAVTHIVDNEDSTDIHAGVVRAIAQGDNVNHCRSPS